MSVLKLISLEQQCGADSWRRVLHRFHSRKKDSQQSRTPQGRLALHSYYQTTPVEKCYILSFRSLWIDGVKECLAIWLYRSLIRKTLSCYLVRLKAFTKASRVLLHPDMCLRYYFCSETTRLATNSAVIVSTLEYSNMEDRFRL